MSAEKLKWVSLSRRMLWLTVSNALLRSRNAEPWYLFLSSAFLVFKMNRQLAESVECLEWKPYCIGWSGVGPLSRYSIVSFDTHFSATLEMTGRMLIGL